MEIFEKPLRPRRKFGRVLSRPQLQVLRNQSVGKIHNGAVLDPQFVAVARMRISSVEFLAYLMSTSKKPPFNASVSQSSNSASFLERAALRVINSWYGKAACG